MLKHKTISQISFKGYRIALVETESDYVVALGYKGHKDSWDSGHYFPKWSEKPEENATNDYIECISKEICYWL